MKKIVVNRVKNHTVGHLIKELENTEKLVNSDNKFYEKFLNSIIERDKPVPVYTAGVTIQSL